MARSSEDIANDPVLVPIPDDGPTITFDEWLESLHDIEPTDVDANAAEIIRGIREHGER